MREHSDSIESAEQKFTSSTQPDLRRFGRVVQLLVPCEEEAREGINVGARTCKFWSLCDDEGYTVGDISITVRDPADFDKIIGNLKIWSEGSLDELPTHR